MSNIVRLIVADSGQAYVHYINMYVRFKFWCCHFPTWPPYTSTIWFHNSTTRSWSDQNNIRDVYACRPKVTRDELESLEVHQMVLRLFGQSISPTGKVIKSMLMGTLASFYHNWQKLEILNKNMAFLHISEAYIGRYWRQVGGARVMLLVLYSISNLFFKILDSN